MIFHRDKSVGILTPRNISTHCLIEKIKMILSCLPPFLREYSKIVCSSKSEIVLSNGSRVSAASTSLNSVCRTALSLLVIDEAAFVDNLDQIWMAMYPSISVDGCCIAISTHNGVGNWFCQMWEGSLSGENDFHGIRLP